MAENKGLRVNEQIRVREVRLIDDEGEQKGIVPTIEALKMARERELDLVEVAAFRAVELRVQTIAARGRQKRKRTIRRGLGAEPFGRFKPLRVTRAVVVAVGGDLFREDLDLPRGRAEGIDDRVLAEFAEIVVSLRVFENREGDDARVPEFVKRREPHAVLKRLHARGVVEALHPTHFIEAFFVEAFQKLGGTLRKREKGRYEVTYVPHAVRTRDMQIGYGIPVLRRYERICFDKQDISLPNKPQADLVCPGHPLLDAVIDLIREMSTDLLKRGTMFVDERDESTDARLLFYIEDAVQDGMPAPNGGQRIISKHIHFVEMKADGTAHSAGYAPYLDYRAPTAEEVQAVRDWLDSQDWLLEHPEENAQNYAIEHLIPSHFAQVQKQKLTLLDKIEKAVKDRLQAEIQYWDFRAADLGEKEAAGKVNAKLNAQQAQRRADELAGRMKKRLAEIKKEKHLTPLPPIVTGGALVIPLGLLQQLLGEPTPDTFSQGDKKAIEMAAMRAVMQIETSLGYIPKDVSCAKVGYDIESLVPEKLRTGNNAAALRFIEVKGRQKGATIVTVSKNEILTALNERDKFILAIVEVDGATTHTIYLQQPFTNAPDFTATSVNYDLQDLVRNATILYEK